jgi:hypothetical protein
MAGLLQFPVPKCLQTVKAPAVNFSLFICPFHTLNHVVAVQFAVMLIIPWLHRYIGWPNHCCLPYWPALQPVCTVSAAPSAC